MEYVVYKFLTRDLPVKQRLLSLGFRGRAGRPFLPERRLVEGGPGSGCGGYLQSGGLGGQKARV